ncbi:hypothetical protein I7I53_08172 [Histoplasma capsulatum var. duboisii H88]|uniref:Uncharacterized protein n=1 Tax=Ajellomyces capsulatus (strain H88) TaxID=544711 RepID=A0A8A1LIP0_AJEC8|nr:hypothetical protein I7I53_08172 [Histoplasma capsulatum var. duboisii H88]
MMRMGTVIPESRFEMALCSLPTTRRDPGSLLGPWSVISLTLTTLGMHQPLPSPETFTGQWIISRLNRYSDRGSM